MRTKSSPTLDRYIAQEFLFSFLVSFLFYFFIFFLNQILLMAQGILAKGIPVGSVLLLLLYSLPSFITLSTPFATLTAALMTYGRFSSDNEILAMRSAGFRRFTIFRPVFIIGIVLAFLSFGVNDILLPAGTRSFQRLWLELSLTNPGLELEPYSVRSYQDSIMVTGTIDDEGIHPMMIIERTPSGDRTLIMADAATPNEERRQSGIPGFRMENVFTLTPDARAKDEWSWTTAGLMEYRLIMENSNVLDQQPGPSNLRVSEVRQVINEKQSRHDDRLSIHQLRQGETTYRILSLYRALAAAGETIPPAIRTRLDQDWVELQNLRGSQPRDRSLQIWKLEYFQKYAIPFACIPFVVLAYPLGLLAKRSGRAVGFFIGLLMTSFYWGLLVLGRSLGLRTDVSPFVVMIVPNLVLLSVGLLLYLAGGRK